MTDISEKFKRQLGLFGIEGQKKISKTYVVIVGYGGLGTQIFQALLLLGVSRIAVIEPQNFDETNRNRYIGFKHTDVGHHKLTAATRLAADINPDAIIITIPYPLESQKAFEAIKEGDIIIGCLDHDGPRTILNEVCVAYSKPLIDVASEIANDGSGFGGRVTIAMEGVGCLQCIGDGLDQDEIRRYFSSDEALANEATIYGVGVDELKGGTGPSVVSINGQIANAAITEFMALVTGAMQVCRAQIHRMHLRMITKPKKLSDIECRICQIYNQKETANVERYLKM